MTARNVLLVSGVTVVAGVLIMAGVTTWAISQVMVRP